MPGKRLQRADYHVAWIAPVSDLELLPSRLMLDEEHDTPDYDTTYDDNIYICGSIACHNVVIVTCPHGLTGNVNAGRATTLMFKTFSGIRMAVLVGIGGGVPHAEQSEDPTKNVHLGDVVVGWPGDGGPACVYYDAGRWHTDKQFEILGTIDKPDRVLLNALSKLTSDHEMDQSTFQEHRQRLLASKHKRKFTFPGLDRDQLFQAAYRHKGSYGNKCARCDTAKLVDRPARTEEDAAGLIFHRGRIATGSAVVQDAKHRDQIRERSKGALCIEMEAAGVDASRQCLVIRGISDYCDSHKGDAWRSYAAGNAAIFARELLSKIKPLDLPDGETSQSKDAGRNSDMQRLSDDQREVLLNTLKFSQIDSRLWSVTAAHITTCRWFLEHQKYLDWLDPQKLPDHHGFLWIKGKAGAGKSTLMKFAHTSSFQSETRGSVSFFFNARGAELEKTTIGMYRSLLLQLLEPRKELRRAFENAGLKPWNATNDFVWSIECLKQVFKQAVHGLEQSVQVTCFIDALDECPESEVRDMVEFFEDLGTYAVENQISFRVLFSSRHYPHITISKGLSLVLEGQKGHSEDIKNYVEGKLKIMVEDDARSQIVSRIEKKASGVFMWVVLVVDMMNESRSWPIVDIHRKLEELPSELHQLFQGILVRDESHRDELLLSLQWILFARRALTPNELYCAVFAGRIKWDGADEKAQQFVLDSSKGLAEVIETKPGATANKKVVQFIHESVRDFLLKDGGLKTLWPDLGDNFEDQSHNTLKECCLNHINTKDVKALHTEEGISDSPESVKDRFPFLEYATQNVLYHADAAAASVSQVDLLGGYPHLRWVALHNLFEQSESSQYSSDVTLAYILAEDDAGRLLAAQLSMSGKSGLEVENEQFGTPLFAALVAQSRRAALVILQVNAQTQNSVPELQDICRQFAQSAASGHWDYRFLFMKEETRLWYQALGKGDDIIAAFLLTLERATRGTIHDIEVKGSGVLRWDMRTPLHLATRFGLVASAQILFNNGADIEGKNRYGRTPLSLAVESGMRDMVKLLLDAGADVETKDRNGLTPLSLAAQKGEQVMVKLLLNNAADIEGKDDDGRTPLSWAAGAGNKATVKLLLEAGALIEARDSEGRIPLSWARDEATVKLLLKAGALTEARDINGRTPLSLAAREGDEAMVKLLLDNGADIEGKDRDSRTPLSLAAQNGKQAIVKLLLDARALIEARDNNRRTPLSWAASDGDEATVKLLLKAGALIEARDNNGWTPLSWAAGEGHEATVKPLLKAGALFEARDNDGRTPLSWAASCRWDTLEVSKILIENGAMVGTKDKNGETPLDWAKKEHKDSVVRYLESIVLRDAGLIPRRNRII